MNEYLVDTSVWVEYFRGKKIAVKKRLEKLLDENRAHVSGIILAELITGISNEKDQRFLEECFFGLPYLEATREIFSITGKMGAALRKKGITMPLSDLLIAALAKTHVLTVLTLDNHFQTLARPLNVQMELLKVF
ncbi:MAG: PIN domain-containing protein [Candidatus Aminicenantes bacterium]|nr:PIN domain-containing protein [Candidatus Aminicenantes bacterium]